MCGKPQRESDLAFESEMAPPPAVVPEVVTAPPEPPPAPPITLANGAAVRAALLACGLAIVLSAALTPLRLNLIATLAGGFLAVYLYRRRTGLPVSVVSGMRLGWMTGLFAFLLMAIMMILMVLALSDPQIAAEVKAQATQHGAGDINQLFEMLDKPSGVAMLVAGEFFSSTLLMGLGAMAGAKFLSRRGS